MSMLNHLLGSFAIVYKEKGPSLIWGGKSSCAKNQLDLIQAHRTLKEKKRNACKSPWVNSNLVNLYNGLPKGVNSVFAEKQVIIPEGSRLNKLWILWRPSHACVNIDSCTQIHWQSRTEWHIPQDPEETVLPGRLENAKAPPCVVHTKPRRLPYKRLS